MNIKTTKAFTMRNASTGALTSYAAGQIYVVDSTLGGQLITDGLAVEYTGTVAIPTGSVNINTNGTHSVAQYETAKVNVPNPSTGKLEITGTEEVNVTDYAKAQVVDEYLVADNIKKDVTILGVTGTYEGEEETPDDPPAEMS